MKNFPTYIIMNVLENLLINDRSQFSYAVCRIHWPQQITSTDLPHLNNRIGKKVNSELILLSYPSFSHLLLLSRAELPPDVEEEVEPILGGVLGLDELGARVDDEEVDPLVVELAALGDLGEVQRVVIIRSWSENDLILPRRRSAVLPPVRDVRAVMEAIHGLKRQVLNRIRRTARRGWHKVRPSFKAHVRGAVVERFLVGDEVLADGGVDQRADGFEARGLVVLAGQVGPLQEDVVRFLFREAGAVVLCWSVVGGSRDGEGGQGEEGDDDGCELHNECFLFVCE